jgi:hypothetical protein
MNDHEFYKRRAIELAANAPDFSFEGFDARWSSQER